MNGILTGVMAATGALALASSGIAEDEIGTRERDWKNASGKKIKATLAKIVHNSAELRVRSKSYHVPIASLSEADQKLIEKMRKESEMITKRYRDNRDTLSAKDVMLAWIFGKEEEMLVYMRQRWSSPPYRRYIADKVVQIEKSISDQTSTLVMECGLILTGKDTDLRGRNYKMVRDGKTLVCMPKVSRGTAPRVVVAEVGHQSQLVGANVEFGSAGLINGIHVTGCERLKDR